MPKFNSPINLLGNQLLNFLVHNVESNPINANPGRLVFNSTDNGFYGGVQNPTIGGYKWVAFVTENNIGTFLGGAGFAKARDIPAKVKVADGGNGSSVTMKTYTFYNLDESASLFSFDIPIATALTSAGLMSQQHVLMLNDAYGKFTLLNDNYNSLLEQVGNCATKDELANYGYDRSFKADTMPLVADIADVGMPADAEGKFFYFDTAHKVLYLSVDDANDVKPGQQKDTKLYRSWQSVNDFVNFRSSDEYEIEGTMIYVGSKIFRRSVVGYDMYGQPTMAWVEFFSATSSSIESRVAALEKLLGPQNTSNKIDEWNEILAFLNGISPSNNGLQTWMQSTTAAVEAAQQTADDAQNTASSAAATAASALASANNKISKPTSIDEGKTLIAGANGSIVWQTTKVAEEWTLAEKAEPTTSDKTRTISITALGTPDVVVKLYEKRKPAAGSPTTATYWDEIMADVGIRITATIGSEPPSIDAIITFGEYIAGTYKAVIIAL